MPELPEVETVARDLRRHLLPEGGGPGPVVAGARVAWSGTLRDGDPAAFTSAVSGRRIEAVGRRGKLLILDLDGGEFLTVHLKMTGQLFVVPAAMPLDPYERLALVLDDGREIRFRDIRKFGRVGLYAADDHPFDGIGPEPLDPRFTIRAFRARIRGRRARLKPLLVDQSFIAGVGNIYADEALWRSKLHPLRSAASLRPHDERALYRNVLDILTVAVERRGSSIDDYTAPDGDGEMQEHLDVYQRTGRPCPRCGRPIRRIVIGIRATHFCSFCQRLPAGERPAAAKLLATMTPRPGRAASERRGRRWVDLDGEGSLGRTLDEGAKARERTARTKAAAAARRAAARRGATAETAPDTRPKTGPSSDDGPGPGPRSDGSGPRSDGGAA
jgi:formamidopyrimidine-DNA glycosylase